MLIINSLIIFSIYILLNVNFIKTNYLCEDWTSFKDEKCIKVIDRQNIFDFNEGIDLCRKTNNSSLLTIHSRDEQEFIENVLYKTIVSQEWFELRSNAWIGLRYENTFKWSDNSELDFTNWANGCPKFENNQVCGQLSLESEEFGEWVDNPCNERAVVICERSPITSLSYMRKSMLELVRGLNNERTELSETLNDVNENLSEINKMSEHFIDMLFETRNLLGSQINEINNTVSKLGNDLSVLKNDIDDIKLMLNDLMNEFVSNKINKRYIVL